MVEFQLKFLSVVSLYRNKHFKSHTILSENSLCVTVMAVVI
jgi:hypothetical protein